MTLVTMPKRTSPLVIPPDNKWVDLIKQTSVGGTTGQKIDIGVFANVSGYFKDITGPGAYQGLLEVRACRNGITNEQDPNFDETAINDYPLVVRYKGSNGLWYWKQRLSHSFPKTKNFTSLTWQIRVATPRSVHSALVKSGCYCCAGN